MNKEEPTQQQIIAELIHSFEDALALVTSAIAKEGDTERIKISLQTMIAAAKTTQTVSPIAIHITTTALAAVEAVRLEKLANDPDQHKH